MDWDDFEAAQLRVLGSEPPSMLFMEGVAFDNQTRYLQVQKGTAYTNTETDLFQDDHDGADFVWSGSKVRVLTGFASGGHPALAGFDTVYCAGEIHKTYFFFKSGHYKPQLLNVTHFLFDFVAKSCGALAGGPRDAAVDRLCKIRHKIYVDGSETETYMASLEQIINGDLGKSQAKLSSGAIAIPTRGSSVRPVISVQVYRQPDAIVFAPKLRPIWQLDSDAASCYRCKKEFGALRWRHHCRQCGYVVCDDCSKRKKVVDLPATRPGEKAVARTTEAVRVCDNC